MNGSGRDNRHSWPPSDGGVSWATVVVFLVAFWPVGLLLLFRKITCSPQKAAPDSFTSELRSIWSTIRSGLEGAFSWQGGYAGPRGDGSSSRRARSGAGEGLRADEDEDSRKAVDPRKASERAAFTLGLLGALLGLAGAALLAAGIVWLFVYGHNLSGVWAAVSGAFLSAGGLVSLLLRGAELGRLRRFTRYAAAIGARRVAPLLEISKAVGESPKSVRRVLEAMIDRGFFGKSAYIDSELDSLVLSFEDACAARAERSASEGRPAASNPFVAAVNDLHLLKAAAADPEVGEKIGRLMDLTVKIFRCVEANPEKLPQVRRFMNYYLPTTLKLLRSYETLERQGVGGENIQTAKQEIKRVLDTLTKGFEQQLDQLFRSDALDISAEIDVLENLMEQDGLKRMAGESELGGES